MEFAASSFQRRIKAGLKVLICGDCVFWCGSCSEASLKSKKSINQLASSDACSKFQPRGGSQ
jgi:hypothetical protein